MPNLAGLETLVKEKDEIIGRLNELLQATKDNKVTRDYSVIHRINWNSPWNP